MEGKKIELVPAAVILLKQEWGFLRNISFFAYCSQAGMNFSDSRRVTNPIKCIILFDVILCFKLFKRVSVQGAG